MMILRSNVAQIANLSLACLGLVSSFSYGRNIPRIRRVISTTTFLPAMTRDNEEVSAKISNDWIQSAIIETAARENNDNSRNPEKTLSSNIETKFILVNTKHPGNVGSSARSMKTMGFSPHGLVVVNPNDARVLGRKKCIDAASGALDILEHAILVANDDYDDDADDNPNHSCLKDAIQQLFGNDDDTMNSPILICGTGMPVDMSQKRASQQYLEPRKFFDRLLDAIPNNNETNHHNRNSLRIAFVFGNERCGMLPQDMEACDVMLGIPTHPSFGSLNLATAVQIIAYDWRQALGGF